MTKLLLLLLLVVPEVALAQGIAIQPKVLRQVRPVSTGALMPEPPNTVTHVWFDGVNLVDTKAMGWVAASGGVPRRPPVYTPMISPKGNAGPAIAATRWATSGGSDALDQANFEACVSFVPVTPGTLQYLFGNGNFSTVGYHVGINTNGTVFAQVVAATATTTNTVIPGVLNVLCMGRSSTTATIQLNGGAPATATVATTSDATRAAYLGTGNAGTSPHLGYLVEFTFASTAYSSAWASTVHSTISSRRTK